MKSIQPLTAATYAVALEHNRKTLKFQLARKGLCMQDYYWLSACGKLVQSPGNNQLDVNRMSDDMVAATVVGSIPFAGKHGVDALMLVEGKFKEIEVKLSYRCKSVFSMGVKGGLYQGGAALKSAIAASYEIVNNLSKKNIDTYFVVIDQDDCRIVEVSMLSGAVVVEKLNNCTGKKRSIKLSTFLIHGKMIRDDHFTVLGVDEWQKEIRIALAPKPAQVVDQNATFIEKVYQGVTELLADRSLSY
jgi:hypothetical protein